MKNPKNSDLPIIAIALVMILALYGCDKFKGATGPEGPALTGNIVGYVALYDEYGRKLSDHSDVSVRTADSAVSTLTTSSGKWVLDGLKTGCYTLIFSKAGCGTIKRYGLQFSGGGDYFYGSALPILQLPAFTITSLSVTPSSTSISLNGTISSPAVTGQSRSVRFFISTSNTVSADPARYNYTTLSASTTTSSFALTITSSTFNSAGLFSGTTIYIIAYPTSSRYYYDEGITYLESGYLDPETGRKVYPSIGSTPSNIVMTAVP
jgi:hypothetical protein